MLVHILLVFSLLTWPLFSVPVYMRYYVSIETSYSDITQYYSGVAHHKGDVGSVGRNCETDDAETAHALLGLHSNGSYCVVT